MQERRIGFAEVLRQPLLDRQRVVQALGHHARQLLQARIAVEFERIEFLLARVEHRAARLHLAVGLDLHLAQLRTQPRDAFAHVAERLLDLAQLRLDARTRDGDFAGLGDQIVEPLGIDPQHGGRSRRGAQPRAGGIAQLVEIAGKAIHLHLEILEHRRRQVARFDRELDAAFHEVRELAEPDGARHACASLEGMECALHPVGKLGVRRSRLPCAQIARDLRDELGRLFQEHRQELCVDVVAHHALFFRLARHEQPCRQRLERRYRFSSNRQRLLVVGGRDHFAQVGDGASDECCIGFFHRLASVRHPLLERRSKRGNRLEACGARAAGERMRGPHEFVWRGGAAIRAPAAALRLERADVRPGFLEIDFDDAWLQALRERSDRRAVHDERLANAKLRGPIGDGTDGSARKLEELGGNRALFLEPAVQDLLNLPRRFAQLGLADHAAAALQRVESATDGD